MPSEYDKKLIREILGRKGSMQLPKQIALSEKPAGIRQVDNSVPRENWKKLLAGQTISGQASAPLENVARNIMLKLEGPDDEACPISVTINRRDRSILAFQADQVIDIEWGAGGHICQAQFDLHSGIAFTIIGSSLSVYIRRDFQQITSWNAKIAWPMNSGVGTENLDYVALASIGSIPKTRLTRTVNWGSVTSPPTGGVLTYTANANNTGVSFNVPNYAKKVSIYRQKFSGSAPDYYEYAFSFREGQGASQGMLALGSPNAHWPRFGSCQPCIDYPIVGQMGILFLSGLELQYPADIVQPVVSFEIDLP